ncbi:MAG: hypothetical protein ACFFB3_05740 [Candidatus Hodarchaeota archaeon]
MGEGQHNNPINPRDKHIIIRLNIMLKDIVKQFDSKEELAKKIEESIGEFITKLNESKASEAAYLAAKGWMCFHGTQGNPITMRWADWNDFCWSDRNG